MENHGLESAIQDDLSNVRLPLNVDDISWDTSPSSMSQTDISAGFTDMTFALVAFESASLMRVVLRNSVPLKGAEQEYRNFHSRVREQTWRYIEQKYLQALDVSNAQQAIVLDTAKLTFERIRLTGLRPITRTHVPSVVSADTELKYKQC